VDSLRALGQPPRPARDTIKAPITQAEVPRPADVTGRYVWTRDSIYNAGALTLADLLDRIPGVLAFRAGWVAAPAVAGYMGDLRRIRVFYDGIELPVLDPRSGRILDLSWVQLWTVEEVLAERGAAELRVYLRSWRVDRTTPQSRVDVFTGDQSTNVFRGFFGRRYEHGEILQVAGQQFSTTPSRLNGSSDQLSLFARLGIARRLWGIDALVLRTSAHRGFIARLDEFSETALAAPFDTLPTLDAVRTDAYLRASAGSVDRGPWIQGIASVLGFRYDAFRTVVRPDVPTDTLGQQIDTTAQHQQFLLTGGYTSGPFRVSLAQRVSVFERLPRFRPPSLIELHEQPPREADYTVWTPSARFSYDIPWLTASLFAEGRGLDSTARVEAMARVSAFSLLAFSGAVGRTWDDRRFVALDSTTVVVADAGNGIFGRAEGAVRLRQLWLGGGLLRRDVSVLYPPRIFSDSLRDPFGLRLGSAATGTFVFARGSIYKALKVDLLGVRWGDSSFYLPKYQSRAELYVATNLLNRFPSGNFGLRASLVHEYRSKVRFPDRALLEGPLADRFTVDSRVLNGLIEIRIADAVLQYQYRNLLAADYEQVPGYLMPRQTQYYGVRWNFFN